MAKYLVLIFILGTLSFAQSNNSMQQLCKEMNLIPAGKAVVQWERVFSSEKRKKRYHIDQLPSEIQSMLKAYLIDHAADSSQPMVPGL